MSRSLLLGLLVLVIAAGGAAYYMSQNGLSFGPVPAVVGTVGPLKDPFGDRMDPKDPGEVHYRQGRYPEAIDFWTGAAARGDIPAAHRLGVEYMDGKPGVVQRDFKKALTYHLQAARGGDPLSMFDLGTMYEFGQGVEQDLSKAAKWYGYAANYGLAQGQYNFATMLEAGDGVAKDEVEAYKFFVLAARNGFTGVPYNRGNYQIDKQAPTPAETLGRKLSEAQMREGRARADAFKALSGQLKGE